MATVKTIWIRKKSSDTWHFHLRCQHYRRFMRRTHNDRTFQYQAIAYKPKGGEFCNECLGKARRGRA